VCMSLHRHATTLGLVFVVLALVIVPLVCRPDFEVAAPSIPEDESVDPDPDGSGELDSKLSAIKTYTEAKQFVARELVKGHLDLLTAAARIREIDRRSPHFKWEEFRRGYPTATDEERHCREVIEWVRSVLPDDGESDDRVRKLEEELDHYLHEGPLSLPERE